MSAHELYADVPREPRALSPEATLHLALQQRTDELERVREAAASVERTMQKQIYTLTRERDEARGLHEAAEAALQEAMRERDEARADLLARDIDAAEYAEIDRRRAALEQVHASGVGVIMSDGVVATTVDLVTHTAQAYVPLDSVAQHVRERDEARAELERVRVEWHSEALLLRRRMHEIGSERDELLGHLDAARAALAAARAELETLRMLTDDGALAAALDDVARVCTLTDHGAATAAPTTPGQGVLAPVTAGPVSLAGARPAAVDAGHPAHVPSAEALRWAEAVR